ncbi:hypothetical protein KAU88_00610 [Candidatus Bathyarchaeota archaeon]|nr:hypothetical protein [Candidatus Bathyarchaeota archaeon]
MRKDERPICSHQPSGQLIAKPQISQVLENMSGITFYSSLQFVVSAPTTMRNIPTPNITAVLNRALDTSPYTIESFNPLFK